MSVKEGCVTGLRGLGSAVGSKTEVDGVRVLRETHPSSHGVDDFLIAVDPSISSLLPVSVLRAIIAARVSLVGLLVGHGLGAAVALITDALRAVAETIGEASCTVVHERVGGEDSLDLPVSVIS